MKQVLNFKQNAFCYHYLACGGNGHQAAILAGYSPKAAKETASRLLTFANVKEEIKRLQDNLAETAGITSLMLALEHKKIAFSDITSLHNTWLTRKEIDELTAEQKACIQEVSTKVTKVNIGTKEAPIIADVEYIKIKTYDKQKALDALSNLLGFNAPTKTELTGKDGKDIFPSYNYDALTDEELKKLHDLHEKMEKASPSRDVYTLKRLKQ